MLLQFLYALYKRLTQFYYTVQQEKKQKKIKIKENCQDPWNNFDSKALPIMDGGKLSREQKMEGGNIQTNPLILLLAHS